MGRGNHVMLLSVSDFGSDPMIVNVAYTATTNGKEGSLLCFLIEVVCFLIEVSAQLTGVSPSKQQVLSDSADQQRGGGNVMDSNLVDSASSHTLVSKIKPCMSKYKYLTLKLRTAHYISYNLFDSPLLLG